MIYDTVQAEPRSKCVLMLTTNTRHDTCVHPNGIVHSLTSNICICISRQYFSSHGQIYHVGSATNRCGIEMDRMLACARSLQVGRRATHFSAPHPFRSDITWPHNANKRTQLIPYFYPTQRHDAENVYDYEQALLWGLPVWQTKCWCIVHCGNFPPEVLVRTETLEGQLLQERPPAATLETRRNFSPLPPVCSGGRPLTISSRNAGRRPHARTSKPSATS